MIFAVFDPSPLTVCINCSFKKHLLNILIALVAKPQSNSRARNSQEPMVGVATGTYMGVAIKLLWACLVL